MNTNNEKLASVWQLLLYAMLTVVASCGGGNSVGTEQMISGTNSKTWVLDSEVTTGDIEQGALQFYAEGRFAIGDAEDVQTGTWSFDKTAKRLSLQYKEVEKTENYKVLKLTDDEMVLRAEDGTTMNLKLMPK